MIKEYCIGDEVKLENSDIFDFKDCLFDAKLLIGDTRYLNLKKWIRYTAVDYGDADQVLKTKNNRILKEIGWTNFENIDCIYSFKTFFNAFLRLYFNGSMPSYGELMDEFDELFSDKALNKFGMEYHIDKKCIDEFLQQLSSFAKNTHTLGNYMPCPDKVYNGIKGYNKGYEYFQDRLELLYQALKNKTCSDYIKNETCEKWLEWFDQNKDNLCLTQMLDNEELLSYKCSSKVGSGGWIIFAMKNKQDILNYTSYLKTINDIIEERTKSLILNCKNIFNRMG